MVNIRKYEINEKTNTGENNCDDSLETILIENMSRIEIVKAWLILFFIIFLNTSIIVNNICN